MDAFKHVMQAQQTVALQEKPARSAYVFGATGKLGEAVLNQVLGTPLYTQVYVSTNTAMQVGIAHLTPHVFDTDYPLLDNAAYVDCYVVINEPTHDTEHVSWSAINARDGGYSQVPPQEVPQQLMQFDRAVLQQLAVNPQLRVQCSVIAPEQTKQQLQTWLTPFANHWRCSAFGMTDSAQKTKKAYTFQAQGSSFFDRFAVSLLNLISKTVASMLQTDAQAPLTLARWVPRLFAQLQLEQHDNSGLVRLLDMQDLRQQS